MIDILFLGFETTSFAFASLSRLGWLESFEKFVVPLFLLRWAIFESGWNDIRLISASGFSSSETSESKFLWLYESLDTVVLLSKFSNHFLLSIRFKWNQLFSFTYWLSFLPQHQNHHLSIYSLKWTKFSAYYQINITRYLRQRKHD